MTSSTINLASLTSNQGFSISDAPANSQSGYSVAGVGDINNDGINDVIIGAPNANNFAGISYIIYGGTTLSNINLANMESSQGFSISGVNNSYSSTSVAGAGDINKDGYDDIIISAPGGNVNEGISYVVFGGIGLSNIDLVSMLPSQGFTITGVTVSGSGSSVSGIGDVNNDGYDDIVIGDNGANNYAGISYVIYGGISLSNIDLASMNSSQGFSISGPSNSYSGLSVARAGDVNNDGYDDIIIGAPEANNQRGISYVIYGNGTLNNINLASITSSQGFSITGASAYSLTGWSVAGAGDINSDDYDDVIICSYDIDIAYVIYGNLTLNNINLGGMVASQGFSISGANFNGEGTSASGAGDINNDDYDDIIIGSPGISSSYVVYGSATLNNVNLINMTSFQGFSILETSIGIGGLFGYSVAAVGDINNDGYDDIIIGAPQANIYAGITYVVYGAASGFITNSPTINPAFAPTLPPNYKTIISLSSLSNYQGIEINGAVSSSGGYSVSSAGDINNDGYNDFMIGAPYANNYAGKSYVIYGSSEIDSSINLVQIGSQGVTISGQSDSYTGSSLANAGDINRDGFSDFAICSPNTGIAYVIYGSNSLSTISLDSLISVQGFFISSASANSVSGRSVAGIGDINNDGIDDVIIGASGANNDAGISYVIYGGTALSNINLDSMVTSQGFSIYGIDSSQSGFAVAGAGDVNNDDYTDIIIGAPDANAKAGISYVIYGGATLGNIDLGNITSSQGLSISGTLSSESGSSVAAAGDINNDGYEDIIIGAYAANNLAGISYIIFGNKTEFLTNIDLATLTINQGFSISGPSNSWSGSSVAGAGDINNDGYDDVIIGAPVANNYAGISYIVYGGAALTNISLASMTSSQGFSLSGAPTGSYGGQSVAGAGDINNDGYSDVIIGAPNTNYDVGMAYIVYGSSSPSNIDLASMNSSQGFSISGASDYDYFGNSVAGAGDVNNDGYDDILIGAEEASIIYVIYGSSSLSNINLASMTSSQGFSVSGISNSDSGYSVAGVKDINNDGYDDIVIGAPDANNNAGITYVIYGGTALSNINLAHFPYRPQGFSVSGLTPSNSGCNIASAGDINGDSYDDIIIGNPSANDYNGAAYVIYGNANFLSNIVLNIFNPMSGFNITGIAIAGYLGNSVAGIGDINNDGYADIAVGAPYANSNAGITYVLFGNTTLNTPNLANINPSQGFSILGIADSQSGFAVAGAGDLNKDGYNDIIIGAPNINNATGEVYVIYGQTDFNTLELSALTLLQGFNIIGISNSYCGFSANSAGDINNDTYPDLIIGAPYANNQAGEAYVIYGNAAFSPINLANLGSNQGFYINSAQPYSQCGYAVSGAGDINNDGYADIIIGASNYVYANSIAGAAFIVYGAESGFTTSSPTPLPTSPTFSSNDDIENSIEFKVGFAVASFIIPVLATWFLREKIAFYVLDNWGHKYKLYNPYLPLKENEIGIKHSLNNDLICIVNFNEYPLLDSDNDGHGISKHLRNIITKAIENQQTSKVFTLLQHEQNQIRDYLIAHKYLIPTRTYCLLNSYTELGYVKGTLYNLFLDNFESDHSRACKKQARSESVTGQIPMNTIPTNSADNSGAQSTSNPILRDSTTHSPQNTQWSLRRSERNTDFGDVENSISISSMEISEHTTRPLTTNAKIKSNCILMSIDASKETSEAIAEMIFGTKKLPAPIYEILSVKAVIDIVDVTPKEIQTIPVVDEVPYANNIHFSDSNMMMTSLLSARQLVEYLPLIKYLAHSVNISLPEILDDKPVLISTHLVLGYEAAKLLPGDVSNFGLILSPLSTGVYAIRLMSADYLSDKKVDLLAQNEPINEVELTDYCGYTMLAYTVPTIAQCAIMKIINTEAKCGLNGQLTFSASIAASECYSIYKESSGLTEPKTTSDIVVPYIADAVALAVGIYNYQGLTLTVISSTFAIHSLSRIAIDIVPTEVKETYIDPIWNYIGETYEYCASGINAAVGNMYDYF